jgi:hypothetical protein
MLFLANDNGGIPLSIFIIFLNFKTIIMKKLRLIALFVGIATLSFAQPTFTEKNLTDMRQRMLADPAKVTKEEVSLDFVMVGHAGQPCDYDCLMNLNANATLTEWPMEQIKIRQVGNVAIVTGISRHAAVYKKTNTKTQYNQRFTDTYEYKNGKWMWLTAQYTDIVPPAAVEEAAIKKVLVDERNAFYAGDKEALAKTWKIGPTTFINASYTSGSQFYRNPEAVQKSITDFKRSESVVGTITSSKIKVFGNNAIADLEVTANYKNGTEAKEHNIVLLEKEADAWKVSGYSVHGVPKDKKEDSAAIVKIIEKETQSWHNRDAEGRIACIANVPYAVMLVYHGNMATNNGVAYVTNEKTNAPEAMKTQMAGMGKPNGTTFKNDNYVVTIKGGAAFVSYDETTTAADGTKQYAHAVRNLERIDGLWKLTYIGGVFYKP